MSDNLFNGRRFRALTVVDNFSRECVAIHAGKSLKGEHVVGVMEVAGAGQAPAGTYSDR